MTTTPTTGPMPAPMTGPQASVSQQLRGHLAALKLTTAAEHLPSVLADAEAQGWTMTAIASIRLSRQHDDEIRMFEEAVKGWDEVIECQLVTGARDYVLTVMSAGLDHYERFIKDKIAKLKCVDTIETSFVMNTIKARRS